MLSQNKYNHLIESNDNISQNPNYINNINPNQLYSNQNINMSGENNNNLIIEDDLIQNQNENNQNPNMISSGFNPIQRPFQKLKWRNIMKIDLDMIRYNKDLSLLNSNLENIIFSDVTEEDIQSVPEDNVIKLIKVIQILNELLLDHRQRINNRLISLQQQGEQIAKKNQELDINLSKQKEYLLKAEQEANLRIKQIIDYKNIVNNLIKQGKSLGGKNTNIKITDINMDINNIGYNNINMENNNYLKNGYKCKYCIGKLFPSQFELKKHMEDIHMLSDYDNEPQAIKSIKTKTQTTIPIEVNLQPLNNLGNNNNNNNSLLEKKMNDMRFEFQNQMHQLEMDKLKNQMLHQKNMNDNGENCKIQMEKMGNAFNDTLKQVLGVLVNNQNTQPKIIKRKNKEKIGKLDEKINLLKKEIEDTYFKEKELDSKLIKIKNEINELNIKKQEINIIPRPQIKPKKTQLVPMQNTHLLYTKNIIYPKRDRTDFHSGDIVSDHDDSDLERKRAKKNITKITTLIEKLTQKKETNIINTDSFSNPEEENELNLNSNVDILKMPKPDGKINLEKFYEKYTARDNRFIHKSNKKYKTAIEDDNFNTNNNVKKFAKNQKNKYIEEQPKLFKDIIKIPLVSTVPELKDLEKGDLKETIKILKLKLNKMYDKGREEEQLTAIKNYLHQQDNNDNEDDLLKDW